MSFSLKDANIEKEIFVKRAALVSFFVFVMLLVLAGRMLFLQVSEYELYAGKSEKNRVQIEPVPPIRGLIFDRNGVLLAENLPSHSLTVVPERVENLDYSLKLVDQLVGLSERELENFEKRIDQWRRPYEAITLKHQLSEEEIARLMVNSNFLPGIQVEAELVRHYPQGKYFAHVLGYVGHMNERDKQRLDSAQYKATKRVGKIGIERYYEDQLHGQVGLQKVETNAQGRILNVLEREDPVPGKNLILNLDVNLQKVAMDAFEGRRGSLVAMDPKTGGVLAMVSTPSFDPNLFVNGISYKKYNALRDDLDTPLFDRATRGQYPPGSTMKPFLGLAFLEAGVTDWQETIADPGWYMLENDPRVYRDWKRSGHGEAIDLRDAIIQSCDTYYYEMAFRTGIDRLQPFLEKFGFGQRTSVDVQNELSALLPTRDWKRHHRGRSWYAGDTLNLALGQGFMLTTPLQLAQATSVYAAKGKWHRSKLVYSVDGNVLEETEKPEDVIITDPANWDRMNRAMEGVITHYLGTARNLESRLSYRVASKTGTAQVVGIDQDAEYDSEALEERQRDHALYMAFAPVEDPKIAVAVIVENGESAGRTAAPIAIKVMDEYLLNQPKRPESLGIVGASDGR
ncbi:penicillin-binding protein 2 [Bermanella marisrubri]|uniref:Peptidoglycan D,D-transpeptidase MrdA n=1 Tax=Bermanella marisrubri TaxID=207949 RepID=Q1N080_9GAMM|nr:penicillin-binding protein 2 [Bermanella marisrubri]EAT11637.1 Cell division protein FtsI/penicillin-binding protein 2 [Oceanobacter sp. RED65] [Bermanella marisrubri]QIZ83322.1 penicillin-binding protein 2 [Bermanella marisrubri]